MLDARTHARTHARTDTKVILYSDQCYAMLFKSLHLAEIWTLSSAFYTVSKNVLLCHFPYLRQIVTDIPNLPTGTYCEQLAIKWLLNIPPHFNCVATLQCKTHIFKNHYISQSSVAT